MTILSIGKVAMSTIFVSILHKSAEDGSEDNIWPGINEICNKRLNVLMNMTAAIFSSQRLFQEMSV